MSLSVAQKAEIMKAHQKGANDTGSAPVQVAVLTAEIQQLTEHLSQHKKDNSSRRGLLKKVALRRSLLDYLKKHDEKAYQALIEKLGIRR